MIIVVAAALAATQPAAVQAAPAPAPAPHSAMGQAGSKMKECCCCKDKMGKEHASHDMDRMQDHQADASR